MDKHDGLFTDTLRWWRSWTWRSLLETVCLRGVAICIRGLEIARKPQTPSGAKLILRIRDEWEGRAPVELQRDARGVVVLAGGRFLRVKP